MRTCAYMQSYTLMHAYTWFSPLKTRCKHTARHTNTHTQPDTHESHLLDSELRQPIISFNPFIMFLFSFPPVWGKKRWMQTGIPAYKEKHTASGWENKSREFLGRGGTLVCRGYACVHRYLARRREAALFRWLRYMHVYVSVLSASSLAHADQWTEGSSLCQSRDPLRSDGCQ